MPRPFLPVVHPEIFVLRPDYCALSVVAEQVHNDASGTSRPELLVGSPTTWAESHLEAWRETYRALGAKPQRTPCSAEALMTRQRRDGGLPAINPVVDLYNALSVRYALPVGGEDIDTYASIPELRRASGTETFGTTKDGAPFDEPVPAGEVIWADSAGVTCRRWNWRQGNRTRITPSTTRMWFVLERLEPMPIGALLEAGHELEQGLRSFGPHVETAMTLIDRERTVTVRTP